MGIQIDTVAVRGRLMSVIEDFDAGRPLDPVTLGQLFTEDLPGLCDLAEAAFMAVPPMAELVPGGGINAVCDHCGRRGAHDNLPAIIAANVENNQLRILLGWSNGTLIAHEAEALLGVGRGELWALERAQMEKLKAARKEQALPSRAELVGSEPYFTGGMTSKEFVGEIRGDG